MDTIARFEKAVEDALTELEGSRNVATKADSMLLLKETLMAANMYADFQRRCHENKGLTTKSSSPTA